MGTAVTDSRPADYQAGLIIRRPRLAYRSVQADDIHTVNRPDNLPAVGLEPPGDILGESNISASLNGNTVIVIQVDELAQAQRPGQRSRLRSHSLHKVTVGNDSVSVMVNYLMPRPVVMRRQPPPGNSHPDAIGKTLPQRPGGHFHARDKPILRVPRRPALPLPELLEFLQRQVIAGEVKKSIEHGRGVPGREDKTVPVRPPGVAGVVLQKPVPQHVSHRRHTHGRARMAGVRLLHGVYRQKPHGIDTPFVKIRSGYYRRLLRAAVSLFPHLYPSSALSPSGAGPAWDSNAGAQ